MVGGASVGVGVGVSGCRGRGCRGCRGWRNSMGGGGAVHVVMMMPGCCLRRRNYCEQRSIAWADTRRRRCRRWFAARSSLAASPLQPATPRQTATPQKTTTPPAGFNDAKQAQATLAKEKLTTPMTCRYIQPPAPPNRQIPIFKKNTKNHPAPKSSLFGIHSGQQLNVRVWVQVHV